MYTHTTQDQYSCKTMTDTTTLYVIVKLKTIIMHYSSLGPVGQDEDRQYTALGSHELAASNAPYDLPDAEPDQAANSPYYLTIIG